jgi:hypothetical protein
MTGAKHNHPPSDQELVLQPFADAIAEAQNWLDGEPVQSEAQMEAVDDLIKQVRKAKTTLEAERKKAVAPLNDAVKAENAAWKAAQEPVEITLTALVEIVKDFKSKIAAEKAAAAQAEADAARQAEQAAIDAARAAHGSGDAEKHKAALEAEKAAKAAKREASKADGAAQVKGMRTVTKHDIEDVGALINWIAQNDRAALIEFAQEYARRHHTLKPMDGIRVWKEKEAF